MYEKQTKNLSKPKINDKLSKKKTKLTKNINQQSVSILS